MPTPLYVTYLFAQLILYGTCVVIGLMIIFAICGIQIFFNFWRSQLTNLRVRVESNCGRRLFNRVER